MEVEILLEEVGSYQQDSEPFILPLPSCLCFLSSTRETFLSFYHDALLHHGPEAREPANAGCWIQISETMSQKTPNLSSYASFGVCSVSE